MKFQTLSVRIDNAVSECRQGRVLSVVRLRLHRISNVLHHIPKQLELLFDVYRDEKQAGVYTADQLASGSARRTSLDASQHHVYVNGVAASFGYDIRTTTHAVGELLLRHHPRWKRGSTGVGVGSGAWGAWSVLCCNGGIFEHWSAPWKRRDIGGREAATLVISRCVVGHGGT